MSTRTRTFLAAAAAVIALAAASTVAAAAVWGGFRDGRAPVAMDPRAARAATPATCALPDLAGTVVHVTLADMGARGNGSGMGGPMMGGSYANGGMMRLVPDRATVPHGTVSFVATNSGTLNHELVVLPLRAGDTAGTRAVGDDGTVDETTSLGEASKSCGAGAGDGIAPGSSSWLTLTLTPGRYELVCNVAGHYAAGMWAELTVV